MSHDQQAPGNTGGGRSQAIVLAMTGASGAPYGLRLLESLLQAGEEVHFVISEPGRMVVNTETDVRLTSRPTDIHATLSARYPGPGRLHVFGLQDWMAPMASGSNAPRAVVIAPCTSGTLASVASGTCRSLIDRAADVALKERRRLILVPREMPFSVLHLENMLKLAQLGAVIMPPSPGFYQNPTCIEDLVDFVVARILDHLDIDQTLLPRWGAERVATDTPSTQEPSLHE
jgi:4-hydroxy-3-polyprenylbenzoate decarboxylase